MAGVWIEGRSTLREVFRLLNAREWDCNWLITDLECYDYCGWEGCEKWSRDQLFLSNQVLLHDVELRDMQFVWGILSAIPARYSKEQVLSEQLPSFESNRGESRVLLPQHPLAFLEISSEDSSSVTVIAKDAKILQPLYQLPEWTQDAERQNQQFCQMQRIVDQLINELGYGGMNEWMQTNLLFHLWHCLYHHQPEKTVQEKEIRELYLRISGNHLSA